MKYIKPEIEITKINIEDVITASPTGVTPKNSITFSATTTTTESVGSVDAASIYDN